MDAQCIDCGLCMEIASDNFVHQDEGGYAYVGKQPEGEREKGLCVEAMGTCPVEAIGDDGE